MGFRLGNRGGRAVLVDGDLVWDLEAVSAGAFGSDPLTAVARHGELHEVYGRRHEHEPVARVVEGGFGPPVPKPPKALGIGLNYRRHAEETGAELPPAPLTFAKLPTCIAGPESDIELSGDRVDWEVELVVVIGTAGRRIPQARAWDHVAGLMVGQDISDRTVQRLGTPPQFTLGKSFDGYGPTGPWITSPDLVPDRDDLALFCEVSGELMQHSRTSDLIFPVAELVAYLSSICTLEPGDLVFTGTPEGVGLARGRFLQPGDTVVSAIESLGGLANRCVAAPARAEAVTA
jgi:2,4-didehydro-3-deoxy-L-rhamnonate hydrolase